MSLRLENEEKKPVLPEPERKANGDAVSCRFDGRRVLQKL